MELANFLSPPTQAAKFATSLLASSSTNLAERVGRVDGTKADHPVPVKAA
jgi:hypothetical protein